MNAHRSHLVAIALLAASGTTADAGTVSWVDPLDGMFGDGTNWSGGVVPLPADDPHFFEAGVYTVTLDGDYENNEIRIRNGDVLFELAGFTHTSNIPGVGMPNYALTIGEIDGPTSATYLNGTVDYQRILVGSSSSISQPSNDSLLTFGAGALLDGHTIDVSSTGEARVVFRDGAQTTLMYAINTGGGLLGQNNSHVEIIGPGTAVSTSHGVSLGGAGVSSLTVADGATLNAGHSLYLNGYWGPSTTTMVVDDATVITDNFGDQYPDAGSTITVDVLNGGILTTDSHVRIGAAPNPQPVVTVSGPGSLWTITGPVGAIGVNSSALVNIENGGELRMMFWWQSIGDLAGGHGEVLVSTGGTFYVADAIRIGDAGTGVVRVFDGGTAQIESGLALAYEPGSSAEIEVDGPGSCWCQAGFAPTIGRAGDAVFSVTGGGSATFGWSTIGHLAGSSGSLVVDGAGSNCTVETGNLVVGNAGSGSLTLAGGATVDVPSGSILIGSNGSSMSGDGAATALSVDSAGTVAPGTSAGALTLQSPYVQQPSGILDIELGGLSAGAEHDQLIADYATLAGTLRVRLIDGFVPQLGDSFEILTIAVGAGAVTGEFDVVDDGGHYDIDYNADGVVLTVTQSPAPGDIDGNGAVGTTDLLDLLGNWGPCVPPPPAGCVGDINGDGVVDVLDLLLLLGNWG